MSAAAPAAAPTAADRTGLLAGLACYSLWGLLPILFQVLEKAGVAPFALVAWRTLFALPVAGALVLLVGQWRDLKGFGFAEWRALALSAFLIACNWTLYVWAVGQGHTIEASLGYYLNPLLNMAAGRFLFGERIERSGWVAIAFAAAGVVLQAAALGAFPVVSLGLAFSFCAYGVVRKRVRASAQSGLFAECLILTGPAALFLALAPAAMLGRGFEAGPGVGALILLCGPATVAPLACFAIAARRLPLTILGFLQFIAPTLQFGVGLWSGERLTPLAALSFLFIWTGVAVFVAAALLRSRRMADAAQPLAEVARQEA